MEKGLSWIPPKSTNRSYLSSCKKRTHMVFTTSVGNSRRGMSNTTLRFKVVVVTGWQGQLQSWQSLQPTAGERSSCLATTSTLHWKKLCFLLSFFRQIVSLGTADCAKYESQETFVYSLLTVSLNAPNLCWRVKQARLCESLLRKTETNHPHTIEFTKILHRLAKSTFLPFQNSQFAKCLTSVTFVMSLLANQACVPFQFTFPFLSFPVTFQTG